jgi:type IV pilus assembly protein PilM
MSTNTLVSFDPYLAWLNIREEQRPLNAYQLLGLEPLEANASKINAAILRQRRQLETFHNGAKPELWEQVRDELEAAIALLTDAERKAIFDASLIRKNALARLRGTAGERAPAGPTIACRHCPKENASQRRFCGDCGQLLWDSCSRCGAEVPVDEKFCGLCGANLREAVSAEVDQARAKVAEARALREAGDFDAPLSMLRKLAKSHDPRLDEPIEEGLALIEEIERAIKRHEVEARDAHERATVLLSGQAYEGAINELEEIPPRFRTSEIEATLREAYARRNELLALQGEIRAALAEKRTGDLLPKIERLLHLKPTHEQARKLAVQLRDRALGQAKKKMLEHAYAEAVTLLSQVPSFVRTAEVDKLADHAEELQWLATAIRQAPVVDATLAELIARLAKVAPSHPDLGRWQTQVAECGAQPPSCSRHDYVPWAKSPTPTHLGWPVDWLTSFQSIRVPDAAHARLFREQPGRFCVALGLALQGIDKAPVDMNLLPEEKKFTLKHLSTMLRKRAHKTAWGLDLNTTGLKAVKLTIDPLDGRVEVADACWIKHPKLLSQPDAELERGTMQIAALRTFLEQHPVDDARVVVNLPAHKLLGRFFDLPPVELKKVADAVEYEVRHQIPCALEELYWDWSLITSRELVEHEASRRVVVVAGRDYHVQERLAMLREAKLQPAILTSDCIALHNFLLHEFYGEHAPPPGAGEEPLGHDAIVTLDVGAEATSMVVTSPSVQWFRTFNIAGDQFSEPLVRQFKLTHAQAEALKREPYRVRRMSHLYEAFDPLLENLSNEIIRSLDLFLSLYPDQTLSRIYGVGGGFQLHGLWRRMRHG